MSMLFRLIRNSPIEIQANIGPATGRQYNGRHVRRDVQEQANGVQVNEGHVLALQVNGAVIFGG